MKTEIKASDLIQTLKKSKLNKGTKEFLDNLVELRNSYEDSKGNFMLKIKIYTDDDFNINGESPEFVGNLLIKDPKSVYKEFMEYIEKLEFSCHPSGQYRIVDFKEMLKYHKEELEITGCFSGGGNQTIDVSVCPVSPLIDMGNMVINLAF